MNQPYVWVPADAELKQCAVLARVGGSELPSGLVLSAVPTVQESVSASRNTQYTAAGRESLIP